MQIHHFGGVIIGADPDPAPFPDCFMKSMCCALPGQGSAFGAGSHLVATLTRAEIQALLDAPDPGTLSGTRDRAMLHLAFAAGLRVSELVGIRVDQFDTRAPASIHVMGKGRRERVLPLWRETTAAVKA